MSLTDHQFMRYSRQIMVEEIGEAGQQKLLTSHVLIIGMGGLGSPVALYLAGAGIGEMTLVDFDKVELSNLPRQILFSESDIGKAKVEAAKARIKTLNSDLKVNAIMQQADEQNLAPLLSNVSLVLDCCDNLTSRYAINKICRQHRVPHLMAAAIGTDGQLALFDHRESNAPCYRCLFPEGNEQQLSCRSAGVIGPAVGVMGSCQALTAIRFLTGQQTTASQLHCFDGRTLNWQQWQIKQDPRCPDCSH